MYICFEGYVGCSYTPQTHTCGIPKRLLSLSGSYVTAAPVRGTPKISPPTPAPPLPPPPPPSAVELPRRSWDDEPVVFDGAPPPAALPPPVSCAKKALNADILSRRAGYIGCFSLFFCASLALGRSASRSALSLGPLAFFLCRTFCRPVLYLGRRTRRRRERGRKQELELNRSPVLEGRGLM